MSEMVKRVVKALTTVVSQEGLRWDDMARAAMAAMRYEDGTDEALAIAVSDKVRGGDAVHVIEHWDGMIDAALAENGQ